MQVSPVRCLTDNYAYLVRPDGGRDALVVDPSAAGPVVEALERDGLELRAILNTHHHWDHVAGNETLLDRYGSVPVFGHASDNGRIPRQTELVDAGSEFQCCGLRFRCFHVPGHTLGAVAYLVEDAVFTGDTLFAAGCGRLFEGTAAMMHRSLNVVLGALPDETRVFCGHEYTASNLGFAAHVEPGNRAVKDKIQRVSAMRKRGEPTVPSTLAEEHATNPFLRCDSEEIIRSVDARLGNDRSPVAVLAAIREAKDAF